MEFPPVNLSVSTIVSAKVERSSSEHVGLHCNIFREKISDTLTRLLIQSWSWKRDREAGSWRKFGNFSSFIQENNFILERNLNNIAFSFCLPILIKINFYLLILIKINFWNYV